MNKYLPIKIALQETKDFEGKVQSVLTMRPPTTNDVILAQQHSTQFLANGSQYTNPSETEAQLFAALTDTTREFIGSLAFYDYTLLGKAYDCFLLPLPQFAVKCALLFPKKQEASASKNSEKSPLQS